MSNLPTYKYRPKFTPGPEACVLQSFTEVRGRLAVGGTFFRSIDPGPNQNDITVAVEWQDASNSPTSNPDSSSPGGISRVKLTITDGTTTEIYFANQTGEYQDIIDPETMLPTGTELVWTLSAIPSLRSQVNASSVLVHMPTTDVQQPWSAGSDDDDHIDAFSATNLTGGSGHPSDPDTASPPIRTGPIRSIIHIAQSDSTEDGQLVDVNETLEWNGEEWIPYSL